MPFHFKKTGSGLRWRDPLGDLGKRVVGGAGVIVAASTPRACG
jgi:hypothetical protein